MDEPGGLIHEQGYRVRFHDCGPDLHLGVPALLHLFEEIALLQSEELGYGFAFYEDQSVGWLLSRWDLSFERLPDFNERVTVRTRPRECGKLAANRAFELRGADGAICLSGLSQWIFVDLSRLRPTRIPPKLASAYGMTPEKRQPPFPGEVLPPEREDQAVAIPVRRDDIDLNGHVNNVCYVEWALGSLPDRFDTRRLTHLTAHFQKETLLGATVRAVAEVEGDVVRHAIVGEDGTACLVTTVWDVRGGAGAPPSES
jgi:medium-chain acyl-[acyl-carrier-protein] hydrolase